MAEDVERIVIEDFTDEVDLVELTSVGLQGPVGPEGPQGPEGPAGDTHVPDPSTEPDERWLRTQGGGLVYTPAPLSAQRSGAKITPPDRQNAPNETVTVLQWNSVLWDTAGIVDLANYPTRFTFTETGLWLVIAQVAYEAHSYGRRQSRIHVNGALRTHVSVSPVEHGKETIMTVLGVIRANAGDWAEIAGFQDSGGPLDFIGLYGADYANGTVVYLGKG